MVFCESPNSIFLNPCTDNEAFSVFPSLTRSTATEADDLKVEPIMAVADILCAQLRDICNEALNSGNFPDAMKLAKVAVIRKAGRENDINKYRPISVLPVSSKILERLLKVLLPCFLEEMKVFVDQQYGFLSTKSTEMAVLNATEKYLNNI